MSSDHASHIRPIGWTRPHLEALCTQVREHLETWAGDQDEPDGKRLAQALELARRMEGSLAMLGTEGGARLAAAMGTAIEALVEERMVNTEEGLGVLLEATAILPDYLDRLESGEAETPVILLPLINDLRAASGSNLISEGELFAPDLDAAEPPQIDGRAPDKKTLRRQYEQNLLGWLNHPESPDRAKPLAETFRALQSGFGERIDIRRLGWIGAAVVEAVAAGKIRAGAGLRRLFARTDFALKTIAKDTAAATVEDIDGLTRSFLFHAALAEPGCEPVDALVAAYRLDEILPDRLEMEQARGALAGRNRAMFTSVAQAVREELNQVKEELDQSLRGEAPSPDHLQTQQRALENIGETLSMLGLNRMAGRVRTQAGRVGELTGEPDDPALLDVARELLLVESELEETTRNLGESDFGDEAADGSLLPPAERRRVMRQLLDEGMEDLHQAKQSLDALNRAEAEVDAAGQAVNLLERLAGALDLGGLDEAAALTRANARFVRAEIVEPGALPERRRMQGLAETLTVLEFYLESLLQFDDRGSRFLVSARQRLAELGYWDESAPGMPAETAVSEIEAPAVETPETEEHPAATSPEAETPEQPAVSDLEPDTTETATGEAGAGAPGHPPAPPADDADLDIADIFLEEFDGEAETIKTCLPRLEADPADHEKVAQIRRAFHTLKGSGRMVGAEEIGEFAWHFENLLNQVLDGSLDTEDVLAVLHDGVAALPALRARLKGETAEMDRQDIAELAARADTIASGEAAAKETGETPDEDTETTAEPDEEMAEESVKTPPADAPDPTLVQLMINELSDNLDALDAYLDDADQRGWAAGIDGDLVRAVHTMKGTLRLAPLRDEAEAAQELEHLMQELNDRDELPDRAHLSAMRDVRALFQARLEHLRGEDVDENLFVSTDLAEHIRAQLKALHESAEEPDRQPSIQPAAPPAGEEPAFDEPVGGEAFQVTGDSSEAIFSLDEEAPAEEETLSDEDIRAPEGLEAGEEIDEPAEEETLASGTSEDVPGETGGAVTETATEEPAETTDEETAEEPETAAPAPDETGPEAESADTADTTREEAPAGVAADAFQSPGPPPEQTREDDFQPRPEPAEAAAVIDIDYDSLDQELVEIFLEEGNELLEHSDDLIQKWREEPDDRSTITGLQRNLHTIKGSARMAGMNHIGELAHGMEEVLETVAGGAHAADSEVIDAMELGCDRLHTMLQAVSRREPLPRFDTAAITEVVPEAAEVLELESGIQPGPETEPETPAETGRPETTDQQPAAAHEARRETLRVDAELVDNLVNYAGEISIFRSRLEQQVSVFRTNVTEVDSTVVRLRDQLRKLENETEAQILARYEKEHGAVESDFDPLELDRYSTIQQLSRALAESVNDLTSLAEILDDATRQSETLLMQQSRVNTELQEGLMQARLVSFNTLVPRLRRVVRNATRDTGKKAQLQVNLAGESDLDRNVLDRIAAPLEHMLRNAVAHGIESPDRRAGRDKPASGTVRIDVDREATEMVIRVIDDGAGLDIDAIRRKAVERRLINPDIEMDEDSIARLIFEPGFSTAVEVSELAGRGMGMDVVANEVRQIGGSVNIHTESGRGMRISIRIPLTLAVMQAIMIRAGDRTFAIPLQAVRGVARMLTEDYERAIAESSPEYEYAGERYPLMELEPQLGLEAAEPGGSTLSLLMVQAGEERAALRVSELHGHREVVIKPVGPQISSIPGILGGTITGDGQVVIILDMGPLIHNALQEGRLPGAEALAARTAEADLTKRTPLVMVVDDSITMRRITSRVLENRELEVITAKDGLDAVEIMYERVPDVMLLDIEMPRMDGYELANHVRNDPRLKHIPMMMITSRTGEKHRQHAKEAGVNRYLSKPYQESELVRNVFELLKMKPPES